MQLFYYTYEHQFDKPKTSNTYKLSYSHLDTMPSMRISFFKKPKAEVSEHNSDTQATAHKPLRLLLVDRMIQFIILIACLWLSLCTAVGPIYQADNGLREWSIINTLILVVSFMCYLWIIRAFVRWAQGKSVISNTSKNFLNSITQYAHTILKKQHQTKNTASSNSKSRHNKHSLLHKLKQKLQHNRLSVAILKLSVWIHNNISRIILTSTNKPYKIAIIITIGWLWIPLTLLSAYGADVHSQIREFSWQINQYTHLDQPYAQFFSFVPMDLYPTAHYLWPKTPTYLTDQHNIVLTLLYGASGAISRYFTGSNDLGLVFMSTLQWIFAIFCVTSAMNRFFNLPWLQSHAVFTTPSSFQTPEYSQYLQAVDLQHPERGFTRVKNTNSHNKHSNIPQPATATARFWIIIFFLICPLSIFSTISLTKSPLFAFAFVWWFGACYELHMTHKIHRPFPRGCRRKTFFALLGSVCVMLISAKYAWYILIIQFLIFVIIDRKRWHIYAASILLPIIIIHGSISMLVNQGVIIGGDPIESKGIQIQQIARIAQRNPSAISDDASSKLSKVFNLDQIAQTYYPNDADPSKSSGIWSKKVSYRWRTVTSSDMKEFNKGWLEVVAADPITAIDAFLAKCYGYFNVGDSPYVSMSYYVSSSYVQNSSTWIKNWCYDWRNQITGFYNTIGNIPVLGWITHGNFYVVSTLLLGAAELALKRWRTLLLHIPLLLLMGVMILAPANNFERHMLPLAFCFGFMLLTFWRENQPNLFIEK